MDKDELLASGHLHAAVRDQLVKGEDREAVLAILCKRFPEEEALSIVAEAEAQIEAAKAGGQFETLKAQAYGRRRRSRSLGIDIAGVLLIVFGLGAGGALTMATHHLSVFIVGALVGALMLVYNRR
jgi:hypothetical protein